MKVSLIGLGILKHGSKTRTCHLFSIFLVLLQYGLREETNFPEYKAGKAPINFLSQSFPAIDCHNPRCAWAKSLIVHSSIFARFRSSRVARGSFVFDWPKSSLSATGGGDQPIVQIFAQSRYIAENVKDAASK
jgi:hypothetical protein